MNRNNKTLTPFKIVKYNFKNIENNIIQTTKFPEYIIAHYGKKYNILFVI